MPWCDTQDYFVFWKWRGGELSQDAAPDWHRKIWGILHLISPCCNLPTYEAGAEKFALAGVL